MGVAVIALLAHPRSAAARPRPRTQAGWRESWTGGRDGSLRHTANPTRRRTGEGRGREGNGTRRRTGEGRGRESNRTRKRTGNSENNKFIKAEL